MIIQLSRRTAALALAAFVAVAALATVSFVRTLAPAEASHKFGDIATNSFFHDSTAWLKDNGIADGFDGGRFLPNSNITRGQASYWFANYNDAIELVTTQVSSPTASRNFTLEMQCPAGKRAVAGAGDASSPGDEYLFMTNNFPPVQDKWWVSWRTADGTTTEPTYLQGWALCVPDTIEKP